MPTLSVVSESWPIAGRFAISRGSKSAADVVTVTLDDGRHQGHGECVPYARYGEHVPMAIAALETSRAEIERGISRDAIPGLLEPRAARNALDCALWDLAAKQAGEPVWKLAGLCEPRPAITAFTLSLDAPEAMAEAAAKASDRPLLKLKLGQEGDESRLRLVRRAAPNSRLIVDANEGWNPGNLEAMLKACADAQVELVEQPLPAAGDDALRHVPRPVPVCADESAHGLDSLDRLAGKYDAVNIKLDKTGGLTGALAMATAARQRNFRIMAGCMLATSLAMAPAFLVAQLADWIDLDGPLLLESDRRPGIRYAGSLMHPPPASLWG